MSLRIRLVAASLAMLTALAGLGAWSAWRHWDMGTLSNRIIADNYASVVAAQQMKESLERQDSALLFSLLGEHERARAQLAEHRERFRAALQQAAGNITEPGEPEIIAAITAEERRYTLTIDGLMAAATQAASAPSVSGYFAEAEPAFNRLRAYSDDLLTMNQTAMQRKAADAATAARESFTAAAILALVLTLAGAVAAVLFARSILRPVGELMTATTAVAAGDLDVIVPVGRSDEIGQLAHGFNEMAARLREVRDSNLGELMLARQLAEAAVDSLYDPVIVTDAQGRVTHLNDAAEPLFGSDAEARGHPLAEVARDPLVASAASEVLESQRSVALEGAAATLTSTVGGNERSFRLRSTPMRDSTGRLLGAVVLLEDVTHLHEVDRLKSEFVAAASQELGAPVTSLEMGLHLVLEQGDNLTEQQQEILYNCREETHRLARLSANLLDLSKIESGQTPTRLSPVPTVALLRGAVEPLRLPIEARGIALVLDVTPDLPNVLADRAQIERVIANLVTNAARATPSGGKIAVTAEVRDSHVAIVVADTGVGIPPDYLRRIFEPFVQVPNVPPGAGGLSLAISRRLIDAHHGQMAAQSAPGSGAVFTFTLPLAAPENAVEAVDVAREVNARP